MPNTCGFVGDRGGDCQLTVRKNMAGMSRLASGEQGPVELNVDRISSLPWGILNNILGKLTIVDAAKTSVLAKNWKNKWLSHSDFSLDSVVLSRLLNHRDVKWDLIASIVNKFLLHHTSSIRSFSLKAYCREHYADIYQWIQYLSSQDVEVLVFQDLTYSRLLKMPSYLFSFEKLRSLSLTNCVLRIPSTFERFTWLDELLLKNVSICDADMARLILSCPLLKKLTLLHIYGLEQLRIQAPKLTSLMIDTRYEDLFIGAAPDLFIVSITANEGPELKPVANWGSVISCLSSFGSLRYLSLSGDFIKVMAADYGLDYLPLRNNAVTSLTLHKVRFENVEVFKVCLSLLRTCCNVKRLFLYIEAAKGAKMAVKFFSENSGNFSFPELEIFTVICPGNIGMGSSVNFIDFVISHSPNLKFLIIEKGGSIGLDTGRTASMLHRFKMSCPQALVLFERNGSITSF